MKRILIALLCLVAALALLCACGGSGAPAPVVTDTAPAAAEEPSPAQESAPVGEMAIRFETTAFDGSAVDESILSGAALTMLNFFEPWCPPCIAELPELQALSENYAAEGFQLLGVYSTEEGVDAVLQNAGVSYPALRYVPAFDQYQTGYVPTTVFLDSAGNLIGEPVIGSRSYEQWEQIVKELLA